MKRHSTKVIVSILLATTMGVPAIAAGGDQPDQPDQPATPTANAAEDNDIVVTAQRREQRLTDVPITVTAATGADLVRAGVTTTREIQLVTPSLTLQSTGAWLQPSIRGVTSQGTSPGSEQNVAIYVDGVYQPFAAANAFELPDVQRVEVLKGPQGTLFGRNATGGAIQIITLDPSLDAVTGKITGAYGRFKDTELSGYVSLPLSDKIGVSVSGSHRSSDGWNRNLLTGERYGRIRSDAVRGKLLLQPSDTVKLLLSGFYSKRKDGSISSASLLNGNSQVRALIAAGRFPASTIIPSQPWTVAPGFTTDARTKNWGVSLRATVDTNIGTITSTTAYIENKFHLLTDTDSTPAFLAQVDLFSPPKTFSQELIFSSEKFGRFSFVAGGYAYRNTNGYVPYLSVASLAGTTLTQHKIKTISYAGFAEGTFEITDRLSVIGGLRYTYEHRFVDYNFASVVPPPAPQARTKRDKSFNSVTPRASISYKLNGHSNAYVTYSEGFKSGQYDLSAVTNTPVNPEKLRSIEAGFKTATRDLAFTAAAFYSKYSDLQVQFLSAGSIGSLQNAGKARIYGAELSLKYNLTPELSIVAQGAYTNAKYTDFPFASVTVPLTNAAGVPTGFGNRNTTKDLSGFPLLRAPKVSGNVGLNYDKEFNAGTLSLAGLAYYSSRYAIENGFRIVQPKYVQLNGNIGWTFGKTGPKVGVYGKNLTNRKVFLSNSILTVGDNVSYQERRSYGVNFEFKF